MKKGDKFVFLWNHRCEKYYYIAQDVEEVGDRVHIDALYVNFEGETEETRFEFVLPHQVVPAEELHPELRDLTLEEELML